MIGLLCYCVYCSVSLNYIPPNDSLLFHTQYSDSIFCIFLNFVKVVGHTIDLIWLNVLFILGEIAWHVSRLHILNIRCTISAHHLCIPVIGIPITITFTGGLLLISVFFVCALTNRNHCLSALFRNICFFLILMISVPVFNTSAIFKSFAVFCLFLYSLWGSDWVRSSVFIGCLFLFLQFSIITIYIIQSNINWSEFQLLVQSQMIHGSHPINTWEKRARKKVNNKWIDESINSGTPTHHTLSRDKRNHQKSEKN